MLRQVCSECAEEFCSGSCKEFQYDAYQRLIVPEKEKDAVEDGNGAAGAGGGKRKKKKGRKKGGQHKKKGSKKTAADVNQMPVK